MKEITVQELKSMLDNHEDFQLIDVREPHEDDAGNLQGTLIPLGDILEHASEIARDKKVVIHCRSGMRSATAVRALESHFGFTNLYNLKGGILAYAEAYDKNIQG